MSRVSGSGLDDLVVPDQVARPADCGYIWLVVWAVEQLPAPQHTSVLAFLLQVLSFGARTGSHRRAGRGSLSPALLEALE